MSIPFKEPSPPYNIRLSLEKSNLTKFYKKRGVPRSGRNKLLIASWNIANLGAQHRNEDALKLIAHIIRRFDLIAIQEVNENFRTLVSIINMLRGYDFVMTDTAGNTERLAFVYRKSKVKPRQLFGEIALRKREYPKRSVTVRFKESGEYKLKKYKNIQFIPFDRNPYIGSFQAGNLNFTLVNVHLYFGKWQNSRKQEDQLKYCRRVLEIYAMARWAKRRNDAKTTYDKDILLMGDMNIPVMETTDSAYKALIQFGMQPVNWLTNVGGSNINNDKTYDQVAIAPDTIQDKVLGVGAIDFDNAIFNDKWKELSNQMSHRKATSRFASYMKHHISDHRPIWIQLDTGVT